MNLNALCEEAGVSFYDAELVSENGRKIYRVFIHKEGGVDLEDCTRLSEILSPIFDAKPPCEGAYFLEVSSPGLERRLHTLEHFSKSIGEKVRLSTKENEKIEGEILEVKDDCVILKNEKLGKISLKFDDIKKAKTFVEW